jgi:hypothetical protein
MCTSILLHGEVGFAVDGCAAAEIDDEGIECVIYHDVVGFEVAMKHSFGSEEAETLCDFVGEGEAFFEGEGPAFFDDEVEVVEVGSHVDVVFFAAVFPAFDFQVVFGDVAGLAVSDVVEKAHLVHEGVDGCGFVEVAGFDDQLSPVFLSVGPHCFVQYRFGVYGFPQFKYELPLHDL